MDNKIKRKSSTIQTNDSTTLTMYKELYQHLSDSQKKKVSKSLKKIDINLENYSSEEEDINNVKNNNKLDQEQVYEYFYAKIKTQLKNIKNIYDQSRPKVYRTIIHTIFEYYKLKNDIHDFKPPVEDPFLPKVSNNNYRSIKEMITIIISQLQFIPDLIYELKILEPNIMSDGYKRISKLLSSKMNFKVSESEDKEKNQIKELIKIFYRVRNKELIYQKEWDKLMEYVKIGMDPNIRHMLFKAFYIYFKNKSEVKNICISLNDELKKVDGWNNCYLYTIQDLHDLNLKVYCRTTDCILSYQQQPFWDFGFVKRFDYESTLMIDYIQGDFKQLHFFYRGEIVYKNTIHKSIYHLLANEIMKDMGIDFHPFHYIDDPLQLYKQVEIFLNNNSDIKSTFYHESHYLDMLHEWYLDFFKNNHRIYMSLLGTDQKKIKMLHLDPNSRLGCTDTKGSNLIGIIIENIRSNVKFRAKMFEEIIIYNQESILNKKEGDHVISYWHYIYEHTLNIVMKEHFKREFNSKKKYTKVNKISPKREERRNSIININKDFNDYNNLAKYQLEIKNTDFDSIYDKVKDLSKKSNLFSKDRYDNQMDKTNFGITLIELLKESDNKDESSYYNDFHKNSENLFDEPTFQGEFKVFKEKLQLDMSKLETMKKLNEFKLYSNKTNQKVKVIVQGNKSYQGYIMFINENTCVMQCHDMLYRNATRYFDKKHLKLNTNEIIEILEIEKFI